MPTRYTEAERKLQELEPQEGNAITVVLNGGSMRDGILYEFAENEQGVMEYRYRARVNGVYGFYYCTRDQILSFVKVCKDCEKEECECFEDQEYSETLSASERNVSMPRAPHY